MFLKILNHARLDIDFVTVTNIRTVIGQRANCADNYPLVEYCCQHCQQLDERLVEMMRVYKMITDHH